MEKASHCSGCGEELRNDAKFCDRCGQPDPAAQFQSGDARMSAHWAVKLQRSVVMIMFVIMGLIMVAIGLVIPSFTTQWGDAVVAFRYIPIGMGALLIVFGLLSYFLMYLKPRRI